ncbi:MAG: outer membrane lipoprotein carrier protein LolA [Planctomycetota bacterium]
MRIEAAFVCVVLAALPARAEGEASPEVKAFLQGWGEAMAEVESLRVRFTQTKTLRLLKKPRVSQGLTVLRGRRLHMTVTRDGEPEIELAVDAERARLYYPKRQTVEVFALDGGPPPESPFPLFSGDVAELETTHDLELRDVDGLTELVLVPRDPESKTQRVVMRFKDYRVVAVEQTTRRGDTVSIQVQEFAVNAEVTDAELELDLPADVKVVDGVRGGAR